MYKMKPFDQNCAHCSAHGKTGTAIGFRRAGSSVLAPSHLVDSVPMTAEIGLPMDGVQAFNTDGPKSFHSIVKIEINQLKLLTHFFFRREISDPEAVKTFRL
jgi:hypothetical protein